MSIANIIDPSTGRISSQYATPGAVGPQGPQGPQGPPGPAGTNVGPIVGVSNPASIVAGDMGEALQLEVTVPIVFAPNSIQTVAQITLTPGVWIAFGTVQLLATVALTEAFAGLSYSSGVVPPIPYISNFILIANANTQGFQAVALTAPTQYLVVAPGTTQDLYLLTRFQNSGGVSTDNGSCTGFIQAIRVA